MTAIRSFARKHALRVIEDSAQAHGAMWGGQKVGAIGDVGTFSFYPGKNLGAYGDGGAIVSNDPGISARCRRIANHGRVAKYEHEFEGRNSRLDGLQAAILRTKLRHLPAWTERRNEIAARYLDELAHIADLHLPKVPSLARHVFHLFVVRTPDRAALGEHLSQRGIETGRHYPVALPKLAAYRYLGGPDPEMVANRLDSQLLSLPIGEHLTDTEVSMVVASVCEFFDGRAGIGG